MYRVKIISKNFQKDFPTFKDARNWCVETVYVMHWEFVSGIANDECAIYFIHDNSGYFYIRINKLTLTL